MMIKENDDFVCKFILNMKLQFAYIVHNTSHFLRYFACRRLLFVSFICFSDIFSKNRESAVYYVLTVIIRI